MATQHITDPTPDRGRQHDYHRHAHAEYDALCNSVRDRIALGTMPIEEAYWWARILCDEAMAQLTEHCRAGEPNERTCGTDRQCDRHAA